MINRLLIILCLLTAQAGAQTLLGVSSNMQTRPVVASGGGEGSSFVGAGDIASGASFWASAGSAYSNSVATAKAPIADLVDTSTGLLACTLKTSNNGAADLTTTLCPTSAPLSNVVSWCSLVGGCSVAKLYDQTNTGNFVAQATLAAMPVLTFNAQNGMPCPTGTGSAAVRLVSTTALSMAVPYTITAVSNRTSNVTTTQTVLANATTNLLQYRTLVNAIQLSNGGAANLTVSDNAFHAFIGVASSVDPLFAADSSANIVTTTNGTTSMTSNIAFMGRSIGTTALLSGFDCEVGIWPTDQNANYQALLANMRQRWNF